MHARFNRRRKIADPRAEFENFTRAPHAITAFVATNKEKKKEIRAQVAKMCRKFWCGEFARVRIIFRP